MTVQGQIALCPLSILDITLCDFQSDSTGALSLPNLVQSAQVVVFGFVLKPF
jgi:hypothetical protein